MIRHFMIRFEVREGETLKTALAPEVAVRMEAGQWILTWTNDGGHEFRGSGTLLDEAILDFLRDRLGLPPVVPVVAHYPECPAYDVYHERREVACTCARLARK